jgi:SAM-dependent methyltransferase
VPEAPNLDDDVRATLVRGGYDSIAEDYLRLAGGVPDSHPRRARMAALLADLHPGGSVLEVGCGAGVPVAAEILRNGHPYVGIDVSPRQVGLARKHVPQADVRVGDVLDQTFDPQTFDAVVALYVITHVPRERWASLFHKIHEWLKVGGVLLVNVPDGDSPGWVEEDFLGLGGTNWTNAYGVERTVRMLEAKGFTVVEAVPLADDDTSPNGWVWITARKWAGSPAIAFTDAHSGL